MNEDQTPSEDQTSKEEAEARCVRVQRVRLVARKEDQTSKEEAESLIGNRYVVCEEFRCANGDWEDTQGVGRTLETAVRDLRATEERTCEFQGSHVANRRNFYVCEEPTAPPIPPPQPVYQRLIHKGSSRALTTPDMASHGQAAVRNGAQAFIWDVYSAGGTGYNQLWTFRPDAAGIFVRIVHKGSGRVLTTPDRAASGDAAAFGNGADVFLYDSYNAEGTGYNQLWRLEPVAGGYYRILHKGSGRALTTPDSASHGDAALANGADVFLYDIYDAGGTGYNQLWRLG